jgi:putative CocE/NonD family hydrolase
VGAARAEAHPELPALTIGGWFDIFLRGTLDNWKALPQHPRSRLVIGPWGHIHRGSALGEIDYGNSASGIINDLMAQQLGFLAEILEPVPAQPSPLPSPPGFATGEPGRPPIRLFAMGANRWRETTSWPPPEARVTDLYLHPSGGLSPAPPSADAPPEGFVFDPLHPVPTIGGANLMSTSEGAYQVGPWDQSPLDARTDILRFQTPPLEADVEVVGPLSVTLWAATSAVDTDWTAKLIDVWPDGRAINVADGILRARYHAGTERIDYPAPDEPREYVIDLIATAQLFAAGHRIRVDVSSSNFPRFDVNPGNGGQMADVPKSEYMTARQTIFLDAERPSRISLPIVG